MDLGFVYKQLLDGCKNCKTTLSLTQCHRETVIGLARILYLSCQNCSTLTMVKISTWHLSENTQDTYTEMYASTMLCISQFLAWPSPGQPPGIRTFPLPGGSGFRPTFFAWGSGFWIREVFYSCERKMQGLFDLFQRNRRQLEKQVFLCCFILDCFNYKTGVFLRLFTLMFTKESNYNLRFCTKRKTARLWGIFNKYEEKLSVPNAASIES